MLNNVNITPRATHGNVCFFSIDFSFCQTYIEIGTKLLTIATHSILVAEKIKEQRQQLRVGLWFDSIKYRA